VVAKPAIFKHLGQYTGTIVATPKQAAKATKKSILRPRAGDPKDESEVTNSKGNRKGKRKEKVASKANPKAEVEGDSE
jgi:hypothetical protein